MGTDKAFLALPDGRPLIEHLRDELAAICEDVVVVGGDSTRFKQLGAAIRWTPDAGIGQGPLAGILGALEAVRHQTCLVVACDMPFVTAELIAAMDDELADFDALAYPRGGSFEPLLAIYRRSCLPALHTMLANGNFRAQELFLHIRAGSLSPRALASVDPERLGAVNLNTPEDFEGFRRRWRHAKNPNLDR